MNNPREGEYLATSYRPDRKYLEGIIRDATWGNGITAGCKPFC